MTPSTDTDTGLPLDMIIFGGMGDLAMRKLLPALYMAFLHGNLPTPTRIISTGRQEFDREAYLAHIEANSRSFIASNNFNEKTWDGFLQLLEYVRLDVQQAPDFSALARATHPGAQRVFYLSTAPALFTTICDKLADAGLVDAKARVVLEKPLGHDLASAIEINEAVGKHFAESQIYRIDHYLGKETVQNLMVLRFGNSILEPLWRAPNISSVQITVAEEVGVGSRAGFYDGTGAMRDMVQNHLLQLLCIVAMEPPTSLSPDAVRDEKLKVIRSLRRFGLADIARDTVRGQYTHGVSGNQEVPGYHEEKNVPADSKTETFVALRAHIDTWRWSKVPFYLRTGKRMQRRSSKIVVEFANPPFPLFPDMPGGVANRLVIELQPEEAIKLQLMAKQPGSGMQMQQVALNLDLQSAFQQRRAEAYERLLIDVVRGRLTHFMRRDELEAAWEWADPIIEGWSTLGEKPHPYPAGSWGPSEAFALLARDGFSWFE
ncbi:glucose-6-phosphate dehydrogenase [Massilia sp. IC2-477]|uniref:glucose-6-phosphate dehydrogenase n=1 Tax=unclassified Massilia TaxID=2609279 RepID=UPI001D1129E7|nr:MULTISPECIES: glucose-6-phosphate dehydrogenase [unclassified Massilia]MCC2957430.1 glucose-6-phosphate dehydrogenase [Massilia sp. IC2-477]MCC2973876.1 glucose-6-phosphate dehydrogenase [Massilia sp. IC2-476]